MISLRAALTKYNPNQPRAPRGSANGGQFISAGGGSGGARRDHAFGFAVTVGARGNVGFSSEPISGGDGGYTITARAKNLGKMWFLHPHTGSYVRFHDGLKEFYVTSNDMTFKRVVRQKNGEYKATGTAISSPPPDHVAFNHRGAVVFLPRSGVAASVVTGREFDAALRGEFGDAQQTLDDIFAGRTTPRPRRARATPPQRDWKAKKVDGLDVRVKATVSDTVFARFGGDTADVVGRILSGAKEHKLAVDVDYTSDSYGLYFSAKLRKGKNQVGSISRKFYDKKGSTPAYVYHDYFELDSKFQGQGIAKSIFRKAIPEYAKMGYKEVHVGAGLSEGGYAWAKYGFVPTKQSWSYLLDSVKYRAKDPVQKKFLKTIKKSQPKDIWKIADSEFGHRLLAGTGWDGVLSFSDRDAMDRFTAYVGAATPPKRRTRTLKKAMTTPRTFVMAETLDPDTPPSMDTILRHRAELKARGADEETLDAAYPIRPLQKALRSKSDKLA